VAAAASSSNSEPPKRRLILQERHLLERKKHVIPPKTFPGNFQNVTKKNSCHFNDTPQKCFKKLKFTSRKNWEKLSPRKEVREACGEFLLRDSPKKGRKTYRNRIIQATQNKKFQGHFMPVLSWRAVDAVRSVQVALIAFPALVAQIDSPMVMNTLFKNECCWL
jgi:hypothetical protein